MFTGNPLLDGVVVGRLRGVSETRDQLKLGLISQVAETAGLSDVASFLVVRRKAEDLVEEQEAAAAAVSSRPSPSRPAPAGPTSAVAYLSTHEGGIRLDIRSEGGLPGGDPEVAECYPGLLTGLSVRLGDDGAVAGLSGTFDFEAFTGKELDGEALQRLHTLVDELGEDIEKAHHVLAVHDPPRGHVPRPEGSPGDGASGAAGKKTPAHHTPAGSSPGGKAAENK